MTPASTKTGTIEAPTVMISASEKANWRATQPRRAWLFQPRVWAALRCRGGGGAEHQHRHQVDQRQPPGVEGVDEQVVGIVGGATGDVDLADGEVQQVPDEEEQDRHAAPPHQPAGERRSGALLHHVRHGARAAARRHSITAATTCTTSATTSADPDHPEQSGVRQHRLPERPQVLGVLVERVVAGEGLQVAVHVQQHEAMKTAPLTAIEIFSAIVVRTPRVPVTRGRACCWGTLGLAGATDSR